jgi:predicted oxidoreductase
MMQMKTVSIGGKLAAPEIGLGCMRLSGLDKFAAEHLIRTAMEEGVNFFDHADIYGGGTCESHFAEAIGMNPSLREKMILQTKCGIRPGTSYDFSREHILASVDASLQRLKTDYIDILLLHRPDALMDPVEVAEAFTVLESSGKVKYFGVSNQNPYQIGLLNKHFGGKLVANQMQLSLAYCPMIDAGLNVNTAKEEAVVRDGAILDYCRSIGMTIQAWSPFQYGFFEGTFIGSPEYPELNKKLEEIAARYGVTVGAIAVAWILRHPAKIQTIVGTTNATRVAEICKASDVNLTREEWYALYMAAGKTLP